MERISYPRYYLGRRELAMQRLPPVFLEMRTSRILQVGEDVMFPHFKASIPLQKFHFYYPKV